MLALASALHLGVLGGAPSAWAQSRGGAAGAQSAQPATAGNIITRGRALFDEQQYEESIQTLSPALLRPGTPKADKIEVYRLLAYNYITLNRKEEADAAVRGLYALDETFALPKTESPRFRDFFDDVRRRWEAEGKPGLAEGPVASKPSVTMQHVPSTEARHGTEIVLTGRISDPQKVDSVRLAYRTGSKGKFTVATASLAGGEFRATIPPSAVQAPIVDYYLEALDKGKLPVASAGDAMAPLRVAVSGSSGGGVFSSPFFWGGAAVVVAGGVVAFLVLGKKKTEAPAAGGTSHVTVVVGE